MLYTIIKTLLSSVQKCCSWDFPFEKISGTKMNYTLSLWLKYFSVKKKKKNISPVISFIGLWFQIRIRLETEIVRKQNMQLLTSFSSWRKKFIRRYSCTSFVSPHLIQIIHTKNNISTEVNKRKETNIR